jgi:hypothetical protein
VAPVASVSVAIPLRSSVITRNDST